jgi:hypothetical protein
MESVAQRTPADNELFTLPTDAELQAKADAYVASLQPKKVVLSIDLVG